MTSKGGRSLSFAGKGKGATTSSPEKDARLNLLFDAGREGFRPPGRIWFSAREDDESAPRSIFRKLAADKELRADAVGDSVILHSEPREV